MRLCGLVLSPHNLPPSERYDRHGAIRGDLDAITREEFPWLEKFTNANIIRGFDEGLAHPTACAWVAVLRTNELVLFRDLEATATSITERVERIIDLSGNRREEVKRTVRGLTENQIEIARQYAPHLMNDERRALATGTRVKRYHEIFVREYVRRTFADSKIFKRDPNYPLDDWTQNYIPGGIENGARHKPRPGGARRLREHVAPPGHDAPAPQPRARRGIKPARRAVLHDDGLRDRADAVRRISLGTNQRRRAARGIQRETRGDRRRFD